MMMDRTIQSLNELIRTKNEAFVEYENRLVKFTNQAPLVGLKKSNSIITNLSPFHSFIVYYIAIRSWLDFS